MHLKIDMGTSNTRVWLCENEKTLYEEKRRFGTKLGVTEGKAALFARLRDLLCEVLSKNGLSESEIECIIISGTASCEFGICEIPHIPLPVDVYRIAKSVCVRHIKEITDIPFWFVPGVKEMKGDAISDIMRGEETEIFGILQHLPHNEPAVIMLPGTHNKIIRVNENGEIVGFRTTFSGELIDMIVSKSILNGTVSHNFEISKEYVIKGAGYSERYGVNAAIFHVRVMEKNGVDKDSLSSFLYGAVVGEDVKLVNEYAGAGTMYIGGNARLQAIYQILLEGSNSIPLSRDVSDMAVNSGLQLIYTLYKEQIGGNN